MPAIGVVKNSIGFLRASAKAMMLPGNIPKRFWQFVVSHAANLNNMCFLFVVPTSVEFHQLEPSVPSTLIVASSRINPSALPPSKEYSSASLATQRSSDTSSPTENLSLLHVITLLPLILSCPLSSLELPTSPEWQTFYNLTNPVAEGAVTQQQTSLAHADLSARQRLR
jgi:hypothetical protein